MKQKIVSKTLGELASSFGLFFYEYHLIDPSDKHVTDVINNGWCHTFAVIAQERLSELGIHLDVVHAKNSGHWFLRLNNDTPVYYDAFVFNGTTNLNDIVDRDESDLVVRDKRWFMMCLSGFDTKYEWVKDYVSGLATN